MVDAVIEHLVGARVRTCQMKIDKRVSRYLPLVAAFVCALLVLAGEAFLEQLKTEKTIESRRAQAVDQLSTIRAQLEGAINSTMFLGDGIVAYVLSRYGFDEDEFQSLASELKRHSRYVRDILLLRHDGVTYAYPHRNDALLKQLSEAQASGRPTAALPEKTVEGPISLEESSVFLGSTPIFLPSPGKTERTYWGTASIVVDAPLLLEESRLMAEQMGLRLSIRSRQGFGGHSAVFLGNKTIYAQDPVRLYVSLPGGGDWQLAAVPKIGWLAPRPLLSWDRMLEWSAIIAAAMLAYLAVRAQLRVRHMALHDTLTGLPNRVLFQEHLDQAIIRANRTMSRVAVLHIDLDNFKPINDTYGHKAGDLTLVEVAKRLKGCLREVDTVARIGGDEFVALLADVSTKDDPKRVATKIARAFARPVHLERVAVDVGASIGIAVYPDDSEDAAALIRCADEAMYRAKNRSKLENGAARGTGVETSVAAAGDEA